MLLMYAARVPPLDSLLVAFRQRPSSIAASAASPHASSLRVRPSASRAVFIHTGAFGGGVADPVAALLLPPSHSPLTCSSSHLSGRVRLHAAWRTRPGGALNARARRSFAVVRSRMVRVPLGLFGDKLARVGHTVLLAVRLLPLRVTTLAAACSMMRTSLEVRGRQKFCSVGSDDDDDERVPLRKTDCMRTRRSRSLEDSLVRVAMTLYVMISTAR